MHHPHNPNEPILQETLQRAYEILSEHFPYVVIAAEAVYQEEGEAPVNTQLLRWYGDPTTATGLITYAADVLTRRFGIPAPGQAAPHPQPPLLPSQDEALARALPILAEQFYIIVVIAQSEGEFQGNVERSIKALRCGGPPTAAGGLAQFASNALRKMAVGM